MAEYSFNVTGMSCAACSARVERAVSSLSGVSACAVNLLTHSMRVVGECEAADVIHAVEKAGYGASLADTDAPKARTEQEDEARKECRALGQRFLWSLAFLLLLMVLSMGHGMLGLPLPAFLAENPAAQGLAQFLLCAAVLVINKRFFEGGVRALLHGAPNMDTLVSLGAGVSFLYSTVVLFLMIDALGKGDASSAAHRMHSLYFESAAMILTLITLGKLLEARAKGKTTDAIRSLLALSPENATLWKDGEAVTVPVSSVAVGDILLLLPGERVPVDGTVIEGEGAFDESALTGESLPVDKREGEKLYAGTVGLSGALRFRATGVGEETALSRIVHLVKQASASKAPIAKIADRTAGIFVPFVLIVALVTFAVWMIVGAAMAEALGYAIAVLVVSCPCALGLATPVAIMVGSGVGAKRGILFKTAASLEETGRAKTVVLDKTGTITQGRPAVTDVILCKDVSEEAFLWAAFAAERMSEHPLGGAVVRYCTEKGIASPTVDGFRAVTGEGVLAQTEKGEVRAGKASFVHRGDIPPALLSRAQALAREGKTVLWVALGDALLGMMAVADTVKDESADAVRALNRMGVRTVMLTGDAAPAAHFIAAQVGISEVIAEVLPEGKADAVRAFKKDGGVIMVGDGINDAPALTVADIGIAIGAGTDVAMDAADVVLMGNALTDVAVAISLSRATLRHVKQNLFWAFCYNIVGIPLAAGAFAPLFGWSLSPMFGAAAMSFSSVMVVSNALRLRFFKPSVQRSVNKENEKEKTDMKAELKIEGMMCPHCSGRVKAALEALDCVASAEVSHETGLAIITLAKDCDEALLKQTVRDCGYKVVE